MKTARTVISLVLMFTLLLSVCSTAYAADSMSNDSHVVPVEPFDIIDAACVRYGVSEAACDEQVIADYFTDEIGQLSTIYAMAYPTRSDTFSASSVEKRIPVSIVTLDKDGVYLDFNDDNGYLVITEDREVVEWRTDGDLEYLKNVEQAYYSLLDGFGYYSGAQFIPYEADYYTYDELDALVLENQYDGQSSPGDGDIWNTSQYVADRYGEGYVIKSGDSRSLSFTYFTQGAMSIYYEKKNGLEYTEGNCTLSSIFALMNNLKTSGKYTSLPAASAKTSYDATKDSFYSKYSGNSNYRIETPKSLPNLYLAIRKYAIDNYGYETSGTNPFNIVAMIEAVGAQYNASIDATHIVVWSYESQVVDEIKAGYPVIINVANSSTYGSHSMVVTGYQLYTKTTTVLGIDFNDYVKLIKVNDNWTGAARYFDFTNYAAIGSFVKVR